MKNPKKVVRKAAEARKQSVNKEAIRKAQTNDDTAETVEASKQGEIIPGKMSAVGIPSPFPIRAEDVADLCAILGKLPKVTKSCDYRNTREIHEPMMFGIWAKMFLSELAFPLEVEKSEAPDFVIQLVGKKIGLEVTRIDNPHAQEFRAMQDKGVDKGGIPSGPFMSPRCKMSKKQAKEHLICPKGEPIVGDPGPDTIMKEVERIVSKKSTKLRGFFREGAPCECDLIIDYNGNPDNSWFAGFRREHPECEEHRNKLLGWLNQSLIPQICGEGILRRVVIFSFDGRSCFIVNARSETADFELVKD